MNLRTLAQVLVLSLSFAACGGHHGEGDCEGDCAGHSAGGENEGDCGGHREGGEGRHEGRGEHEGAGEASLPPTLAGFHETVAPVWHSEPGAGRATLACGAAAQLRERAGAVQSGEVPAGVDAAAWTPAAATLVTTADALVATCTAQGADVEAKLTSLHEAFHALVMQARAEH
jgi:hypothetical protein